MHKYLVRWHLCPYIWSINKQQHAMNATAELSKVYKANQCCDATDFEYAMSEVKRIAHKYGWTPALRARMASLVKASKP